MDYDYKKPTKRIETKEIYAKCDEEGDIVIEATLLADILRRMNGLQVEISAKDGDGIDKLKQIVEKTVGTDDFNPSAPLLTTERQRVCVRKAVDNLQEALDGLMMGITTDAINVSVDCAIEELSVLTGEKATETVVNEVFKNFCVGK